MRLEESEPTFFHVVVATDGTDAEEYPGVDGGEVETEYFAGGEGGSPRLRDGGAAGEDGGLGGTGGGNAFSRSGNGFGDGQLQTTGTCDDSLFPGLQKGDDFVLGHGKFLFVARWRLRLVLG